MSCAAMVESIRVKRRCWWGFDASRALCERHRPLAIDPLKAIIRFQISWTMPSGYEMTDQKMYLFGDLINLPIGATPMTTLIYALPYEGHPGACTQGMAYLIRTMDEVGAEDVQARFLRQTNPHGRDMDAEFFLPSGLLESGPGIFPLPIIEEPETDREFWEPDED
jgi:hypothetical protein